MENTGESYKVYDGAVIIDSSFKEHTVIGSDCFVKNSFTGKYCRLERRSVVIDAEIGDYSYTGYNTVVKSSTVGKYCSISWNVSIGGGNHPMDTLSTHLFPMDKNFGFVSDTGAKSAGGVLRQLEMMYGLDQRHAF